MKVSLFRLLGLCAVSMVAVWAVGVAAASAALPFEGALGPKLCRKAPTGTKGLYKTFKCESTENEVNGPYTWAVPDGATKISYCVLNRGLGNPKFKDSLCTELNAGGGFEEAIEAVAFPKALGYGGASKLLGTLSGAKAIVECTGNEFTGQPETGNCSSVKPTGCNVSSAGKSLGTIATESLTGTAETPLLIKFHPETGTNFVSIIYNGASCVVTGIAFPVTGSQMCTWAVGSMTPAEWQELVCHPSESSLVFGGTAANYEGSDHVMFEEGGVWYNP
jgi:hypothetical protein